MADAIFEEPRLAGIYDAIDGDRSDLDVYAALVDELGAHVVLDVAASPLRGGSDGSKRKRRASPRWAPIS